MSLIYIFNLWDKSSQIETNIRDKQRNFDNFSNRQTANDVIWPENGQAPIVQNFIDFRPIFDRFFGQQEPVRETEQLTPLLKSSEDKFLVVKLQEENTKLNHKVTIFQSYITKSKKSYHSFS